MEIRRCTDSIKGILKLSPGDIIRRYFPNMVITPIEPWAMVVTEPKRAKMARAMRAKFSR